MLASLGVCHESWPAVQEGVPKVSTSNRIIMLLRQLVVHPRSDQEINNAGTLLSICTGLKGVRTTLRQICIMHFHEVLLHFKSQF